MLSLELSLIYLGFLCVLGPLFRAVGISHIAFSIISLAVLPSSEAHVVMSLYFSSAVDIAVLTMGENPKEAQDAPSENVPRGAMSDDKLKVGSPCFSSSKLVHTAVYSHRAPRSRFIFTDRAEPRFEL